jgi:hypothetical protein
MAVLPHVFLSAMGIAQSLVTRCFVLTRSIRTMHPTSYDLFARFGNTVTVRRNIKRA